MGKILKLGKIGREGFLHKQIKIKVVWMTLLTV